MNGREAAITVDVGLGKGKATVRACDLTHGGIGITGSYRG
jgi:glutamate N-acetyltransferase / amino-acid N-acetyltransferase